MKKKKFVYQTHSQRVRRENRAQCRLYAISVMFQEGTHKQFESLYLSDPDKFKHLEKELINYEKL